MLLLEGKLKREKGDSFEGGLFFFWGAFCWREGGGVRVLELKKNKSHGGILPERS